MPTGMTCGEAEAPSILASQAGFWTVVQPAVVTASPAASAFVPGSQAETSGAAVGAGGAWAGAEEPDTLAGLGGIYAWHQPGPCGRLACELAHTWPASFNPNHP